MSLYSWTNGEVIIIYAFMFTLAKCKYVQYLYLTKAEMVYTRQTEPLLRETALRRK